MKKILLTGTATIALCITLAAASWDASPTENGGGPTRPTRPRTHAGKPAQQSRTSAVPLKISGGANNDMPLYGMVNDAYDGKMYGYNGPAQIAENDSHVKLRSSNFTNPVSTGCYFDGTYFAVHYKEGSNIQYRLYDAETWEQQGTPVDFVNTNPDRLAYGLTYDPTTKKIYGSFYKDAKKYTVTSDAQFGYIKLDDALNPVEIVGDMGVRMRAMAAAADGTIYGVAYDGTIYTINKETAAINKVSKIDWSKLPGTGSPSSNLWYYAVNSAVIDWETGMMYLSYDDSEGDTFIIKIDPKTGSASVVGNYGYYSGGNETCVMFSGLFFKQTLQQTGVAPLPATDLTAEPVGVELKARLTFKMPELDVENKPLEGKLKYRISDGNADLATGEADKGANVDTTVMVPAKGRTNFVIYVQNGNEESAGISKFAFIGPDVPQISSVPAVFADGKKATIRWQEAWAVNGGNLAEPVTYKIVRMPDNVTVAEAATGNTFVDQVQETLKILYTYIITPKAGDEVGEPVTSRGIYLGTLFGLPYADSFEDEVLFNEYPQIDANRDLNGWWIDTDKGRAVYSGNDKIADDYLLIGPFELKAGTFYNFAMTADGHSIIEHVDVFVGTNPDDVSTFGTNIIPKSTLNPNVGDSHLRGSFVPENDGRYYFAVHACSDAGHKNIYVYDVAVTSVEKNTPDAPVITAVTPKASSAIIEYTVPSKNIDGTDANVTAIRVYRDSELLSEITENVSANATLQYEDTKEVSTGMHIYTITAVNANGEGKEAVKQIYRGLDIPGSPSNLRMVEDLNTPGLIHMSWDAPQRGMNGGYINPDDLTYFVDYSVLGGAAGLESGIGSTSYNLQLQDASKQGLIAASVYAGNAAGNKRTTWITRTTYFGPALSIPLRESWPGMTQKSGIWGGQDLFDDAGLFESMWDVSDGTVSGVVPQDNDGGMFAVSTNVDGRGYRIRSPRVDIKGVENPTLIFYYRYTADTKDYRVEIKVDDKDYTTLKQLDLSEGNAGQWIRQEVSLKDFKDSKYIQIAFAALSEKAAKEFAHLDNFSITDFVANDLAVTGFQAPAKVDINSPATFRLSVRNNGGTEVKGSDYSIRLHKNGVQVSEVDGRDIAPDQILNIELSDTPVVTDPTSTEYYASIVFEADEKTDNNSSSIANVHIVTPVYPRVKDLKGFYNEGGVRLTWSDPSASDMPNTPTTESFENYTAFSIDNFGSWTVHDGDECPTVILTQAIGEINYPHIGEPMAWQVFDPLEANIFAAAWEPRTGNNILVSFQACVNNSRNAASDDWLISPELYGGAQTLSFYARAGMRTEVTEVIDIMYSTSGNRIEDFKPLEKDVAVNYTSDWTEYVYNLPEGTRYFAIVHKTNGGIAVLLDDITYTAAGSSQIKIELQGFNIYRNGVKINSEICGDNEYVDTEIQEGNDYVYHVTAVWDKGESGLSNPVEIKNASVDGIHAHVIRINPIPGAIRIEGADNDLVTVYNVAGLLVVSREITGRDDIPVPAPGIYIVKIANTITKVMVR